MSNDNQLNEQMHEAQDATVEMMGEQVPPMPQRKPKLVIRIEIDNNDLDNAVMELEGTAIDAVEALYVAGKYNESMIKPIIGAAAMLVADDPVLQQKFDELKAYFSKTPHHG